ncbi:type II toxin-antitoxin system HicB family antitoxin [Clostridia bacterium OttesenSCG-928-O13]|nr:type II toxin-antitoxin system HicB family antitoxin [Clostridia bacterium OttesenSCG-928-O13]
MAKAYPVILTPDTGGYVVTVPDLDIGTQGDSVADAIYMARDVIGLWGISQQDAGRAIPEPSDHEPPHGEDEMVTWVDIDFDKYRRANDQRTVRVNVTVPQYLKVLGEDANINFSQTLQKALKEELNIAQ